MRDNNSKIAAFPNMSWKKIDFCQPCRYYKSVSKKKEVYREPYWLIARLINLHLESILKFCCRQDYYGSVAAENSNYRDFISHSQPYVKHFKLIVIKQ